MPLRDTDGDWPAVSEVRVITRKLQRPQAPQSEPGGVWFVTEEFDDGNGLWIKCGVSLE